LLARFCETPLLCGKHFILILLQRQGKKLPCLLVSFDAINTLLYSLFGELVILRHNLEAQVASSHLLGNYCDLP
jgi:hypothetical protein